MSPETTPEDVSCMFLIRAFEEAVLRLFEGGLLVGTTHTSMGQEAIDVALMRGLNDEKDVIFTSHRCHGQFIAYGGSPRELLLELMGDVRGICGGVGGSQHIHYRNLYSSGVQGGAAAICVGMAYAERWKASGGITVSILGDGTLGQGVVFEALNLASLLSAPVLFVLLDNGYAQSTPKRLQHAGNLAERARPFAIPTREVDAQDIFSVKPAVIDAIAAVRESQQPLFLVCRTVRLGPHSKGDDTRTADEIAAARARDPLILLQNRLGAGECDGHRRWAQDEIDRIVAEARES